MSRSDQRQNPTDARFPIARFLLQARRHFGLDLAPLPPHRPARKAAQHGLLRTLLIAGSIGSLLGTTAYAGDSETAPTQSQAECSASSRAAESAGASAPRALERMP